MIQRYHNEPVGLRVTPEPGDYLKLHDRILPDGSEQITVCPDAAGQLPQNPFYFLFFFGHIFFDIIIQVDNSRRFDKQSRTA